MIDSLSIPSALETHLEMQVTRTDSVSLVSLHVDPVNREQSAIDCCTDSSSLMPDINAKWATQTMSWATASEGGGKFTAVNSPLSWDQRGGLNIVSPMTCVDDPKKFSTGRNSAFLVMCLLATAGLTIQLSIDLLIYIYTCVWYIERDWHITVYIYNVNSKYMCIQYIYR